MKEIIYTITDPLGLHARPAGIMVKQIAGYSSDVKITKGDKTVDAKGIIGIMSLGTKQGDTITVTVDGADEEKAAQEIEAFLKENF